MLVSRSDSGESNLRQVDSWKVCLGCLHVPPLPTQPSLSTTTVVSVVFLKVPFEFSFERERERDQPKMGITEQPTAHGLETRCPWELFTFQASLLKPETCRHSSFWLSTLHQMNYFCRVACACVCACVRVCVCTRGGAVTG